MRAFWITGSIVFLVFAAALMVDAAPSNASTGGASAPSQSTTAGGMAAPDDATTGQSVKPKIRPRRNCVAAASFAGVNFVDGAIVQMGDAWVYRAHFVLVTRSATKIWKTFAKRCHKINALGTGTFDADHDVAATVNLRTEQLILYVRLPDCTDGAERDGSGNCVKTRTTNPVCEAPLYDTEAQKGNDPNCYYPGGIGG